VVGTLKFGVEKNAALAPGARPEPALVDVVAHRSLANAKPQLSGAKNESHGKDKKSASHCSSIDSRSLGYIESHVAAPRDSSQSNEKSRAHRSTSTYLASNA
jgi:hypothetical protein